jgi:hypothetical protein
MPDVKPTPNSTATTPQPSASRGALQAAVRAVTEHRLQTELRRMAHLAATGSAPSDWEPTLQRSDLQAIEQQLLGADPLS